MPKDSVFARHHGTSDNPSPFVQVGWDRGREMQIGILAGGDPSEPLLDRPQMWVDLDRDGINRLIRTLRKARDAAFGADA